ncbi:MAG TPA: hypothetical protein DIW30_05795 [Bacteroidales bacterium]|nr:hypothetical protein [Bacteroidales bacterium]
MERFAKILLVVCLPLLVGCKSGRTFFPKDIPAAVVPVVRFDSALLHLDTVHIEEGVRKLYADYPYFMPVFCEDILGVYSSDTAYLQEALPKFLGDTLYGFRQTNAEVLRQYADISGLQQSLDAAFGRLLYLYPDWYVPSVYFFVSGFNASILFLDDDLAVGVDMYLGSDYEFYNRVVYNYQKQTMRKECIPVDVVSAYLFRHIPFNSEKGRLLENMIYRGKIMYLLSLLFPDEPEYEVMGYTKQQWEWCRKYESEIWQRMIDKKDLFRTESMVLTSYLNDGPFTSEISQDAPARLGTWTGWRICKAYMQHNPDVSLQDLMQEADAQKILEQSYYRP